MATPLPKKCINRPEAIGAMRTRSETNLNIRPDDTCESEHGYACPYEKRSFRSQNDRSNQRGSNNSTKDAIESAVMLQSIPGLV
jgi:hypothetical protein